MSARHSGGKLKGAEKGEAEKLAESLEELENSAKLAGAPHQGVTFDQFHHWWCNQDSKVDEVSVPARVAVPPPFPPLPSWVCPNGADTPAA